MKFFMAAGKADGVFFSSRGDRRGNRPSLQVSHVSRHTGDRYEDIRN
jgi:hypothetical protein